MGATRLQFQILGPLAVRVDGEAVPVGGPKQRALLALLLLNANRVVPRKQLVEELFAGQSVNSADHAIRNHVSRLRKALGPDVADAPRLVARTPGYLLRVEPGELDFERFEWLVAEAREALALGHHAAALESLRAAEALWAGPPLADVDFDAFSQVEIERLEELRLAAVEDRIDAELALGGHRTLVAELEALVAQHPYRERFRAQLMLALYRCGRQAEGLEVYRQTRELLIEELGLEPGVDLQQLEHAILVQDPELDVSADGGANAIEPLAGICPFKGLEPFDTGDAGIFFGRERLVDELIARLAEVSLLAIVGPSGSGKSSLLRAGVLPALKLEALVVRPSERSAVDLAEAVEQLAARERLVLAVDQFEELFAAETSEAERRAFVDVLVDEAWNPERRALIVVALRADFFGRLAPYVELADLLSQNQFLLGPMSATELRRAIEGPSARAGLAVEGALVDTLIDEVAGEPGGLPLLSTALLDLWSERENGALTLSAYERTGGVRGAIGRHAEGAFRSLGETQREVARHILLRLVTGGDGEGLTRRRVARSELNADDDEEVSAVLAALVESRLVVANNGTVELVHEALLERWPRLAGWLAEDAQGRALHLRLTQAAAEWERAGRDGSELYRGARLAAALDWADANAPGLNPLESEFLDASRTASEAELARQRRAKRRLRAVLVFTLVLLALAVAGAVVALEQRGQARKEAAAADAQRLGAQALADPNLDQSLLLAREGVNLDDSPATRSNLLAALLRSPDAIGIARIGSERVLDEALSPDGRILAVRGDDGRVGLLNAQTLRPIGAPIATDAAASMFGAVRAPLHALAFSRDGRVLAVGSSTSDSATVQFFDVRTHELLVPYGISPDASLAADVVFAPDGRTFATGEEVNGTMHPPPALIGSWDTRTGVARAHTGWIPNGRLAGYTRNGRFLLVVSGTAKSLLLDARTLSRVRTFPVGGAAALSPRIDAAAFGHPDGTVTLLDLGSGSTTALVGQATGSIETLAFSRDGTTLASGAADGTVGIWSLRARALQKTLHGPSAPVQGAVFSPDGRALYTPTSDGSVIAWDLSGSRRLGRPFRYAAQLPQTFSGAAMSPDGSVFAVATRRDRVALWNTDTHVRLGPDLRAPTGTISSLAFSPDGRLLVAAGDRHAVQWNLKTRVGRTLPTGLGAQAIAFSPDGHTVAIGKGGGYAVFYDSATKQRTASFQGGTASTQDVAFSPDGTLLATVSLDGVARIWDVAKRKQIASVAAPAPAAAFAVAFSPAGRLLAVGDSSGRLVLWDVSRRTRVGQPFLGHGGGISSIDFSPDGSHMATGSADGKLRLWDVTTRQLVGAPLPGSTGGGSVHFFPDGKHVLGVFRSGAAIIWNVDPAAWKATACRVARRNLSRAEWAQFLGKRDYRAVCP